MNSFQLLCCIYSFKKKDGLIISSPYFMTCQLQFVALSDIQHIRDYKTIQARPAEKRIIWINVLSDFNQFWVSCPCVNRILGLRNDNKNREARWERWKDKGRKTFQTVLWQKNWFLGKEIRLLWICFHHYLSFLCHCFSSSLSLSIFLSLLCYFYFFSYRVMQCKWYR